MLSVGGVIRFYFDLNMMGCNKYSCVDESSIFVLYLLLIDVSSAVNQRRSANATVPTGLARNDAMCAVKRRRSLARSFHCQNFE